MSAVILNEVMYYYRFFVTFAAIRLCMSFGDPTGFGVGSQSKVVGKTKQKKKRAKKKRDSKRGEETGVNV